MHAYTHIPRFTDLNAKDITNADLSKYTDKDKQQAEKQAYELCDIFTDNLDGKPCMGSYITAFTYPAPIQ